MAYTNIDDPSAFFNTITYTHAVTPDDRVFTFDGNSDLQPDFSWIKRRDAAAYHILQDSSRGVTKYLNSDSTSVEETYSNYLKSFNTNGLTIGGGDTATNQGSGGTGVIWAWKCNGGSVTTVGESGSNPGFTRQTNTDAGFSIIAYTGTGSNGTIAHGLPSTPELIIFKRRNADQVWATWHQGIGDDYKLVLNSTDAKDADGAFMNSTLPTSSNITVGGASVNTNADGGTYICYAFSPIQGYSKFGKYVGNGNASGPFVYTGFKPAFVMVKCATAAASEWQIYDHKRPGYNFPNYNLSPNNTTAEYTGESYHNMDILSNGFKALLTDVAVNKAGETYTYMAFAEHPFVTSTGIPTTAR